MPFEIEAVCLSNMGRVRRNNEDNFCFAALTMEQENSGFREPVRAVYDSRQKPCMAVFDGMGGENFGEAASYSAAQSMQSLRRGFLDRFRGERKFVQRVALKANAAVLAEAKKLGTLRMGTTMIGLFCSKDAVYVCNLGDSRGYLLREGALTQLSVDHVDFRPVRPGRKPAITQYLGIDPEDLLIEPHIEKREMQHGDCYLLCSDGLTDMVPEEEITEILSTTADLREAVKKLVNSALENGGRDNITVIICRVN